MQQAHFDTSEICYRLGVRHAIFSPGSRNAPLSISFNRHPKIKNYVILDERSAGFIALGIAQEKNEPVVLCCTSGTALLNYGPAIAEAFYLRIPLIIISADRAPEWIDQWDGQTIRQESIFENHTKTSVNLPVELNNVKKEEQYHRLLSDAISLATEDKCGPVHVNVPIREPFYPEVGKSYHFSHSFNIGKKNSSIPIPNNLPGEFRTKLENFRSILIVLGQMETNASFRKELKRLSKAGIPVISDIISNGHEIDEVINHHDLFLMNRSCWKDLKPDLILTFGKSVVSKHLKLFLREVKPEQWHIAPSKETADPFLSLTHSIEYDPIAFLKLIKSGNTEFAGKWRTNNARSFKLIQSLATLDFSDFKAFKIVLEALPSNIDLHLGNSMPVRYANFIGVNKSKLTVRCNRGTSGIDGTNGTAVGNALATKKMVVLLTGDLSFLYDRNAFFHTHDISNLKIIVFNNFGGGIFDLIPGASELPDEEKKKHFIMPHDKDLSLMAGDSGFIYFKCNNELALKEVLIDFFKIQSQPGLLEIQTNPKMNKSVYEKIKKQIINIEY